MLFIMSLSHALSEIYLYGHRYTFFYINNLQDDLTYYLQMMMMMHMMWFLCMCLLQVMVMMNMISQQMMPCC